MSADHYEVSQHKIDAIKAIRDDMKGDSAATQRDRMLRVLRDLGPTSTFEFSRFADIYFPPARKFELIDEGHTIITERRTVTTESGRRHNLGVYALIPGDQVQG